MVGIDTETMLEVAIGARLSKQAVVKDKGSEGCVFNREDSHQNKT